MYQLEQSWVGDKPGLFDSTLINLIDDLPSIFKLQTHRSITSIANVFVLIFRGSDFYQGIFKLRHDIIHDVRNILVGNIHQDIFDHEKISCLSDFLDCFNVIQLHIGIGTACKFINNFVAYVLSIGQIQLLSHRPIPKSNFNNLPDIRFIQSMLKPQDEIHIVANIGVISFPPILFVMPSIKDLLYLL